MRDRNTYRGNRRNVAFHRKPKGKGNGKTSPGREHWDNFCYRCPHHKFANMESTVTWR